MAQLKKLGKRTTLRMAIIRGQVSDLFWYGKVETTLDRAKAVQSEAEKLLTLAMNTYKDNITEIKETGAKGAKVKEEIVKDGAKKLNARRKLMAKLYDYQEQRERKEKPEDFKARTQIAHPIVEKVFNVYAPKYDKRREELGQGGGYTRIIRKEIRRGDNAEIVILEFVD